MKLFVTALKNFTVLGIDVNKNRFNKKMLIASFFLWLTSVFNTTFLIYEADNFKDYTQNLYMSVASTLVALIFIQIVFQISILVNFINGFEKNLAEREYKDKHFMHIKI